MQMKTRRHALQQGVAAAIDAPRRRRLSLGRCDTMNARRRKSLVVLGLLLAAFIHSHPTEKGEKWLEA